jgi:hypothetical protein
LLLFSIIEGQVNLRTGKLGKVETEIKNILSGLSGAHIELFIKKPKAKILVTLSLSDNSAESVSLATH